MQGTFNFWSIILLISIGQALILSFVLVIRPSENPVSSRLLLCMVLAILIVNIDYFFMSSSLYNQLPDFIGISIGLIFVFGPLFYLYFRSIADPYFNWKHVYLINFLPWILYLIYNIQFYKLNNSVKIAIVNSYIQEKTSSDSFLFYIITSLEIIHLSIYLLLSYKILKKPVKENKYKIAMVSRIKWLKSLILIKLIFVVTFFSWFLISSFKSIFVPTIDFTSTLICSAMVFLIAFKLIIDPKILTPGFKKKYNSSSLSELEFEQSLSILLNLMTKDKLYTEPDLKLYEVADQVGVTPHQLSQIINQHFGKSFAEFVNEFRVESIKVFLADPKNNNISLLTLAMNVGFNSKSAFNNAFKKVTGQNPTEYRKSIERKQ